jgi:hypothetical protein
MLHEILVVDDSELLHRLYDLDRQCGELPPVAARLS